MALSTMKSAGITPLAASAPARCVSWSSTVAKAFMRPRYASASAAEAILCRPSRKLGVEMYDP